MTAHKTWSKDRLAETVSSIRSGARLIGVKGSSWLPDGVLQDVVEAIVAKLDEKPTVDTTDTPANGEVLTYDSASGKYKPSPGLTQTQGDARYTQVADLANTTDSAKGTALLGYAPRFNSAKGINLSDLIHEDLTLKMFGASGSSYSTTGTLNGALTQVTVPGGHDFKVGQGICLRGAGGPAPVKEQVTLNITTGADADGGSFIVQLRNFGTNSTYSVTLAASATPSAVRTALLARGYDDWSAAAGGTATEIVFTASKAGARSGTNGYGPGTSGAAASTTTIAGVWRTDHVTVITAVNGNVLTLRDAAVRAPTGTGIDTNVVTHDDTEAINNVYSEVTNFPGGMGIKASRGTYNIGKRDASGNYVSMYPNVRVYGDGEATAFKWQDDMVEVAAQPHFLFGKATGAANLNNSSISHLKVDMNGAKNMLRANLTQQIIPFYLSATDDFLFEQVNVYNNPGNQSFIILGQTASPPSRKVRIVRCKALNSGSGVHNSGGSTSSAGTGTVTLTNNSTTLSGSGTSFLSQLSPGSPLIVSGHIVFVSTVTNDTTAVLDKSWRGTTITGSTFSRIPGLLFNVFKIDHSCIYLETGESLVDGCVFENWVTIDGTDYPVMINGTAIEVHASRSVVRNNIGRNFNTGLNVCAQVTPQIATTYENNKFYHVARGAMFWVNPKVSTTLSAQALSGQAVATFTSVTGFAAGDTVYIGPYATEETKVIQSIAGNNVTMTTNFASTHNSGETAYGEPYEMSDVVFKDNIFEQRYAFHPVIDMSISVLGSIKSARFQGNVLRVAAGATNAYSDINGSGFAIGKVKRLDIVYKNLFQDLAGRAFDLTFPRTNELELTMDDNDFIDCGRTTNVSNYHDVFGALVAPTPTLPWFSLTKNRVKNTSTQFMTQVMRSNVNIARGRFVGNEVSNFPAGATSHINNTGTISNYFHVDHTVEAASSSPAAVVKASVESIWRSPADGKSWKVTGTAGAAAGATNTNWVAQAT